MRRGRPPLKLLSNYLINNYNTDIGNLTLSTHNLFGTKKIVIKRIKIERTERVSAKTRKKR